MSTLLWILLSTGTVSILALSGSLIFFISERVMQRIIRILVGLAAGTLIGGAFLHLIPEALAEAGSDTGVFIWVIAGFSVFFLLEQILQWHHCHHTIHHHRKPITYMILIANGLHNFIGGVAIAGAFIADIRTGIIAWLASAVHEVPQELGDLGILIHGGWSKRRALFVNFISALSIIPGALIVYGVSQRVETTFLLPFAAGNFIYIAASGLIPEIKESRRLKTGVLNFVIFLAGTGLILLTKYFFN